ncbi:MAG: hypothetical protein IRZ16_00205 [Myxococcaceae bacterium]|nr:hypothetical protein [Myxococcaceae bacterium]
MSLIVFLGPSLPAAEARRLAPRATFWPPARQGDIWRALKMRPRAIALIDGVFEAQPSVWHHELLAALDAGVAVFGASSMGALRAAELRDHGMVGIGRIFERYARGAADDGDVALLHADAEHGFRPLTVPLVNAEHAVELARRAKVLSPAEARAVLRAARALHYQERTWPAILRNVSWRKAAQRARFERFLERRRPDLKAEDARACIKAAVAWWKRHARASPVPKLPVRTPSALVRRRRLASSSAHLEALARRSDAREWIDAGLRRALLAGWARSRGVRAEARALAQARAEWLRAIAPRTPDDLGLDEGQIAALMEDVVLERFVLDHAERWLPDGPNETEALASEAHLRGRLVRKQAG